MKVHFSASLSGIPAHLPAYIRITDAIKASGHHLIRDWVSIYQEDPLAPPRNYTKEEWEDISHKTLQAVMQADVLIFEASASSFGSGYQAALALAHKKPILMLFGENEYKRYILDPNSSLRRAEVYRSLEEIDGIVASFLTEHDVTAKDMRFNMVLDRETYNFLQWESAKSGKTKAHIIREVLRERSRDQNGDRLA